MRKSFFLCHFAEQALFKQWSFSVEELLAKSCLQKFDVLKKNI